MPRRPAIALVSDHVLFRHVLAQRLADEGRGTVFQLGTTDRLVATLEKRSIDIVIVDHASSGVSDLVSELRRELPAVHVLVLATPLREAIDDTSVLDAGAIDRAATVAALVPALRVEPAPERDPHRNWSRVTARQRDVMRWLATGLDNATIGQKLAIGERAVKAHVSSLLALFGLDNRTQLALLADRAGLRPPRR